MIECDIAVIGSGPAGQKAAIQAAKAGYSVVMLELDRRVGGACVHRGTIPSKTLRATAVNLRDIRSCKEFVKTQIDPNVQVATLMRRLDEVTENHAHYMREQLERNHIQLVQGRARFLDKRRLHVDQIGGKSTEVVAKHTIVIATGSRPRKPPEIPVDHEHILDSDSILSMIYLPTSLTVLGAGVIASEYASIFAALGTKVTMIDSGAAPVSFMDPELCDHFVRDFEANGGRYLPNSTITRCEWDGVSATETELSTGEIIRSDKVLCALGRLANVEGLGIEEIGIVLTKRNQITVDENCRTAVPSIYAVGDVIGFPALACTSMEQGRRAMCHALGLPQGQNASFTPIGIYTIPEISSVGMTEQQAIAEYGACTVGRAQYKEVARGQISQCGDGIVKLVADAKGEFLLGAHIIGEGACNLIHLAQAALISGWTVDAFIENIFNFPTLAEAYRIAALDLVNRGKQSAQTAPSQKTATLAS